VPIRASKTYGRTASGKRVTDELDPELRQALTECAERDHETTSSVIRKALRKYLQVG
jgi:predicted transcriptional regulator